MNEKEQWIDPIVEEVRRVREELAAKFDFDIDRIVRDVQERQKEHGDRLVTFPPKRPAGWKEPEQKES